MAKRRRAKGEGSINKLSDGRWQGKVTFKGKQLVAYGKTYKECSENLRKRIDESKQPVKVQVFNLKASEWFDKWIEMKKRINAPSTIDYYQRQVDKWFKPHFKQGFPVTAGEVQEWYLFLEARKVSASLQKHLVGSLLTCTRDASKHLKMAIPEEHLLAGFPRVEKREIRVMDKEQIKVFLGEARKGDYFPLYALALDSGMRQGEMFALQWPQVNKDKCTVTILYSIENVGGLKRRKEPKTRSSKRTITVSRFVMDNLMSMERRGEYVFTSQQGMLIDRNYFYTSQHKPLRDRCGFQWLRFHDLRHTCASMLLHEGVNIKAVSQRLGHSDIKVTLEVYAHLMPGCEEKIVQVTRSFFED